MIPILLFLHLLSSNVCIYAEFTNKYVEVKPNIIQSHIHIYIYIYIYIYM